MVVFSELRLCNVGHYYLEHILRFLILQICSAILGKGIYTLFVTVNFSVQCWARFS